MNTAALVPVVYERLLVFLLVMTRVTGFFSTFILFHRQFVNSRIIIALSSILAFYVILLNPTLTLQENTLSVYLIALVFYQVLIGFISGFILNVIFEIISAFSQIVSTQIGLGLAALIDPRFGNITSLTHFYTYATMIIFLLLNGHLLMIQIIVNSFNYLPIDHYFQSSYLLKDILYYTGIIFSGSFMLSLTIIVAILLTNLALALMTKFAPQFNLFSIGVNMTLILGLTTLLITFYLFVDGATEYVNNGIGFVESLLSRLK